MSVAVIVPKWGMNMTHGQVTAWLKQPGAAVQADEPVVELETDKLSGEVAAPAAGVVAAVLAQPGARVQVGQILCVIALPGEDPAEVAREAEAAATAAATGPRAARVAARTTAEAGGGEGGRISPAARRLAREIGLDLADLAALPGKVSREDVLRLFAQRQITPMSHFVEAGDLRWHYVEAGAGQPLLLLHGMGGSWKSWLLNLEALGSRFRVIAPDLPGCGLTDRPPSGYAAFDLARSVLALANALGLPQFAVAGNSLGGGVALHMALTAPTRVQALVLAAPAGLGPEVDAEIATGADVFPDPDNTRAGLQRVFANPGLVSAQLVAEAYGMIMQPGAWEARRATVAANIRDGRQYPLLTDRLPRVQAPALVVWGEQDAVIPVAHAGAAAAIPGARVHRLPGCGHCPQIEAAAAFNALVTEFLGSVGRG